jgi:serine/threonine protein phosphatase PrpC
MGTSLRTTGSDLTDEGPARTVNEDATLVREDLGLFAVADGAGGVGQGNVASALALRSLENYLGQSARLALERPDYDTLGNPEQAKRLSQAVHAAHRNLLEIKHADPTRSEMATTIAALLFSARTEQIHLAYVGDSRVYRLRHGRLELLTVDHTIATDILEKQPDLTDDVLATILRNSVVRALGIDDDFRVSVRTLEALAADRYLLCTDGLWSAVDAEALWRTMRTPATARDLASRLLEQAVALGSPDNVSIVLVDVTEVDLQEDYSTRRYNDIPDPPSVQAPPPLDSEPPVDSARFAGPEIVGSRFLASLGEGLGEGIPVSAALLELEAVEVCAPAVPAKAPDSDPASET